MQSTIHNVIQQTAVPVFKVSVLVAAKCLEVHEKNPKILKANLCQNIRKRNAKSS